MDTDYKGWAEVELDDNQLAAFYTDQRSLNCDLKENEYVFIKHNGTIVDKFCYQHGFLRQVNFNELNSDFSGSLKPRNLQQEIAFDMLRDKQTSVKLITGGFGTGKAQPIDTIIPTPDGEKLLKDIQVGDYVFDRYGNPTQVLGVFPQGVLDNYKITFSDGRITYCNNEHLWSYYTSKKNLKTITTQTMIDNGIKKLNGSSKYSIPVNKPVQYKTKQYKIHPYIIGAFLGDGCCLEERLTISSSDEELVSYVAELLDAHYQKSSLFNYSWYFYSKQNGKILKTKEIFEQFPEIQEYSYNKKIPNEYMYGDINQRLSLLQGLMDTDGSIESKGGRVRFTSCSESLINQVKKLCYSLGLMGNIAITENSQKYTTGKCFTFEINTIRERKEELFHLSRKRFVAKNLPQSKFSRGKYLTIRSIEKMDVPVEMKCIYVDNPEHLYLTNDYIVTHNTLALCAGALDAIQKGRFEKIVWVRNNVQVKDTDQLGALPGSDTQKVLPYAMPLADHCGGVDGLMTLIDQGRLEIIPLGFLRGRSIRDSVIISSEAENLTKQHIQLLIGRVDEGSNLWFDADIKQRDRAIFEETRGIELLIERLQGNPLFGYVKLIKTERSEAAALADLLD